MIEYNNTRIIFRGNPGGIIKFQSWTVQEGERVYSDRLVLRVNGDVELTGQLKSAQEFLL